MASLLLPSTPRADTSSEQRRLLVLAASSLTEPVRQFARQFETEHGVEVQVSFGGSSRLARQIKQGAEPDVFLSADPKWIRHLEERSRINPATRTVFARNRLVWIHPAGRRREVAELDELDRWQPDRLALAGSSVPAGAYAREALQRGDVWSRLEERVVSADNVKRALQWVALGEAEAGVVYRSDAVGHEDVAISFAFPREVQPRIAYEGGVLRGSDRTRLAGTFLDQLAGSPGRSVLRDAGFARVASPEGSSPRADVESTATPPAGEAVDEWSAIRLSLFAGLVTVVGGLIPAILLGWLLARRRFPGRSLVATVLLSPLALPPVVTGFMLLRLFGADGLLGGLLAAVGIEVP
ncbi:MAG: molybdate ABC transporter substrate-binding protein, partial [Bradymonadaceae bacterium]